MSASGSSGFQRYARYALWALIALVFGYVAIVIYAYPHDHEQHLSDAAVAKIEAQKLTDADVDGTNLPPAPDPQQVNATVAGIDANDNGIRDDVELAIFAEYPTSSATSTLVRAAGLQYAMDLQMLLTEVFDTNTWKAAIQQRDRGFACLYDASPEYAELESEVDGDVLNSDERTKRSEAVEQFRTSYKLSSDPDCDVVRG